MLADPISILNLYQKLFSLRKVSSALQVGSFLSLDILPESCFIYQRKTADEKLLIALNFSAEAQTFSLAGDGKAICLLSTHLDRTDGIELKDISLRPNEGLIIRF